MTTTDAAELVLQGDRPIDEQIEEQIRDHVLAGRLQPGEQLPSVRALAVGLAVRPEVVRHALDRLERAGFVTFAEGSGIYAACPPRPADLDQWCQDILTQTAARGFAPADVLAALHAHLQGACNHGEPT
jgi:DNA-binding transcriptional regulator YhcF (GntR family)